jgi:hypothetical protein
MRFSFERENAREAAAERLVRSGEAPTAKAREKALRAARKAEREWQAAVQAWEAADKAHQEALKALGLPEDTETRKAPLFDSQGRVKCLVCGLEAAAHLFAHARGKPIRRCLDCERERNRVHSARTRAKVRARKRAEKNLTTD